MFRVFSSLAVKHNLGTLRGPREETIQKYYRPWLDQLRGTKNLSKEQLEKAFVKLISANEQQEVIIIKKEPEKTVLMPDVFSNQLIEEKKKRFTRIVRLAAEVKKVSMPEVIFNETFCPNHKNEIAHIHLEGKGKICVPKRSLHMMNYLDVEDTAVHEVCHLFVEKHGLEFNKTMSEIKQAIWNKLH